LTLAKAATAAALAAALATAHPGASSAADAAAVGKCLLTRCQSALARCVADGTCARSLVCLNTCAGRPDETACQVRCGDAFASPVIDAFNACAVSGAGCVPQRADDGAYPVPPMDALDPAFDLAAFTGRWYITAGLNPLFDTFPCQEHFFGAPQPGAERGEGRGETALQSSCPPFRALARPHTPHTTLSPSLRHPRRQD
jgi:violaxanthin de-epoxidase